MGALLGVSLKIEREKTIINKYVMFIILNPEGSISYMIFTLIFFPSCVVFVSLCAAKLKIVGQFSRGSVR